MEKTHLLSMNDFGIVIDAAIRNTVNDVLVKGELPDIIFSETDIN